MAELPSLTPPPGVRPARDWSRAPLPARLLLLGVGLFGFGVAIALMIHSRLGLGPWDAFHLGLHRLTGISVGTASILVGVVILFGTHWIGVRPGIGTVLNMVLIGGFIDLLLPLVPEAPDVAWGVGYYLVALGLCGVSTGMYIAPALGHGPRDGLMIALSARSGWPVRRVRTMLELAVLLAGWTMGGEIGAGTVLFTLAIGPAAQLGLQLFGLVPERPASTARAIVDGPAGPLRCAIRRRHRRSDTTRLQ